MNCLPKEPSKRSVYRGLRETFLNGLMSREKSNTPCRFIPILLYDKSHPVKRHSESADTGETRLFRALATGMHRPRLRLDDPRSQANLIVFQAIADQDLKAGVILAKFVYLFGF
jgi:hypothetical protein